jgi:hypothetical protein
MTRKHFIMMADTIRRQVDKAKGTALEKEWLPELKEQANDIASICAKSNPRFNRSRFFRACGLE